MLKQITNEEHKSIKLSEQLRLLSRATRSATPLSEVLEVAGWTFDDLIYRQSNSSKWRGRKPKLLSEFECLKAGPPVVSFFAGCGGMDLGLEAVGFRHVAAFEINELFCKTLRKNRPSWSVVGPPLHAGDVSDFAGIVQILTNKISIPFEGLFVGGPPCQPFSIAANQRFAKWGENFKRTGFSHEKNGNLLFDFVRLICEFKPKAFVIENVPGLRDIDNGDQLAAAIYQLNACGYNVEKPFIVDAANYGVPQQRLRLFLIGSRAARSFQYPSPCSEPIGCGSVLTSKIRKLPNSETREHQAESIRRYMELSYGQRDQLGRVDRLVPPLPSKTVIAGGSGGGGRSHLHPEIPRTLSVRECARLQTFPDDYIFVGPTARQFTQVGNAVPPVLAAQIGRSIIDSYF